MMLDHIGDAERAARIRGALESTLRGGATLTQDLGGSATTDGLADAVIAAL
jgi:isocitrate/isopropylmalate dehydrogenase